MGDCFSDLDLERVITPTPHIATCPRCGRTLKRPVPPMATVGECSKHERVSVRWVYATGASSQPYWPSSLGANKTDGSAPADEMTASSNPGPPPSTAGELIPPADDGPPPLEP